MLAHSQTGKAVLSRVLSITPTIRDSSQRYVITGPTQAAKHRGGRGQRKGAVRGAAFRILLSSVFDSSRASEDLFGLNNNKDHHNAAATSISLHLAHNWQPAVALNKPCGP